MSYYCEFNQCKRVSSEILRQLGPIKTKVIENEQRINKLESNLNMINDNIDNKVEQVFRDQTSQGIKDEVKKIQKTLKTVVDRIDKNEKSVQEILYILKGNIMEHLHIQ